MKKIFFAALAVGLFSMGGVAQATLYVDTNGSQSGGFVDVGDYDNFRGEAIKGVDLSDGSSPAEEVEWVNGVVNENFSVKDYTLTSLNWLLVYSDISNPSAPTPATPKSYAFALPDDPQYFLVKTGKNGTPTDYRWFLFENNVNFDYAVFALQTSGYYIKEIGKIGHVAEIGDPVPEPASMFIFGTGLVGLIGAAWRRKNA